MSQSRLDGVALLHKAQSTRRSRCRYERTARQQAWRGVERNWGVGGFRTPSESGDAPVWSDASCMPAYLQYSHRVHVENGREWVSSASLIVLFDLQTNRSQSGERFLLGSCFFPNAAERTAVRH